MSSLRNPVGPQPPSVYWRRRLLVALGLVAVIVVIVLIVVRPGSGDPSAGQTETPAPQDSSTSAPEASDDPAPEESAPPAASGDACDPASVEVVPVTDADSYAADAVPQISMTVTNRSSAACTFDVGTGAQEYVITSGADRIWSSVDCQSDPSEDVRTLEPGVTLSTSPFAWDRTRSAEDTCDSERPAVSAGGATYRLAVALGEAESAEDKPFLLD